MKLRCRLISGSFFTLGPISCSPVSSNKLVLSLPLQPVWLCQAGSSSSGLLYVSDGYGRRRHGRERCSPEYYEESEPEELTRVFVALFDYDPLSMSPNPDAADEELPFKEGQIIKVVTWPVTLELDLCLCHRSMVVPTRIRCRMTKK